ncbi:MAG: hypothetical protein ACI9BW_004628 [Gammaproteobacteria bacterium]|jgi:hypothetical protein
MSPTSKVAGNSESRFDPLTVEEISKPGGAARKCYKHCSYANSNTERETCLICSQAFHKGSAKVREPGR